MGSWFSKSKTDGSCADASGVLSQSAVLHRDVTEVPPTVVSVSNNTLQLNLGYGVYDGSGGATVSSLGHGFKDRIWKAMGRAYFKVDQIASLSWTTEIGEALAEELVKTTHGQLVKALILNSGSDAAEAALKLGRQYQVENKEPDREWFIARDQSYHGATLGALALSGHKTRRKLFECHLMGKVRHVSACNEYRDRKGGETDEQYVQRKAQELEDMFQEIGPKKVIAFVAEPIVGAALGCVPPVPGYLKAMRAVCHKHGALFILDEIMCGMGRTGTWHVWQQENAVPDILLLGKGLGAGAQPVAALLCNQKIVDVLGLGSKSFMHGHTYQANPVVCAAALEVIRIIRDERLLENVCRQGELLERLLHERLDGHLNVGNIRGRKLFQGIEFVKDKATKEPFDPKHHVYLGFHEKAKSPGYQVYLYPGAGTADPEKGEKGDHIIIAPHFVVTEKEVRMLVDRTVKAIEDYFTDLNFTLEKIDTSK